MTRTPFGQMVRTVLCDACHGDGRVPKQPCRECRGRGRTAVTRELEVDVPAGIADGQRIRLSGRGHAGEAGAPAGDLYVLVRVREDERFVREGDDLITALDVPAPLAALGATLEVPTLEGAARGRAARRAPSRARCSRCAAQGMPALRRGRRGDLRVVVNVSCPAPPERRAARAAGAAEREPHRGEPALGGVDVRQAAPRARQPGRVIRLAVRVEREQAELVLAELLELAPGGVEEVELGRARSSTPSTARPASCPSLPDLRRGRGRALVEISHQRDRRRLERALEAASTARS